MGLGVYKRTKMDQDDIEKAKNDPLLKQIDKHLAEERQKVFNETHYITALVFQLHRLQYGLSLP